MDGADPEAAWSGPDAGLVTQPPRRPPHDGGAGNEVENHTLRVAGDGADLGERKEVDGRQEESRKER